MPLSDWIERLGRAVFEGPFNPTQLSSDVPELAEVRLAVLDEIKARSHRVSGKAVFPYNLIRVRLHGIPTDQTTVFTSGFFSRFLENELRGGLENANYRFPDDLQVEIETTPNLPGPQGRWLSVEPESREKPVRTPSQMRRAARLLVANGTANRAEIVLSKARVNLGRTITVLRSDGPSRRNDLAFVEETDINRTVSREHAHILFDKASSEYRLFNDRSYKPGAKAGENCGLWIIRDGLSHEVHRGARGMKLQPGDEIHLGRAVLVFTLK